MKINHIGSMLAFIGVSLLAGCGGGGGSSTTADSTLSGTAAVGYPIMGGTINVTCAAGPAITPVTTGSSGDWTVSVSGQTLPCAVQVTGGTINGGANTTLYHSIATSTGTVNVTPLTDLLVANLAGATDPAAWFTGLNATQLDAIGAAQVSTALANVRTALGLSALNTIDPVTAAFTPTSGNAMDDILTALADAITSNSTPYATLLNAAGASAGGAITPPANFDTALATAYAATTSGSGNGAGTLTCDTSLFTPGSVQTPSSGELAAHAATYTGSEGTFDTNPPYSLIASGAATLMFNADGTATYNGAALVPTSYCTDSGGGLYIHTANSHFDLWPGTNQWNGVTPSGLMVNNTPYTGGGGATPTITGFSPTSGPVGTVVTITGTNIGNIDFPPSGVMVRIGGTVSIGAVAVFESGQRIDLTIPTGLAAGDYTITVGGSSGTPLTAGTFTVTAGGGGTTSNQMGGAIVGSMLNLTGTVSTLAGNVSGGFADGAGTAASFSFPLGITTDGTNLYVMDSFNNRIRKVVIATGEVTTLAGSTAGFADGTGTAARFNYPKGITTDGTNLYVADTMNHRIRKVVIATGEVTSLAGDIGGYADGTGIAAGFFQPSGITTDGLNLFVADTSNNRIRKVVITTGEVTTMAGNATNGWADGTGTAAMFSGPRGITTDGTYIYVADAGASDKSIRKIVIATGVVTTLAGKTYTGFADGTGTAAIFASPADITTDGVYLYVADYGNERIRKILTTTGEVTTLTGSATGYADGTGSTASFSQPYGITSDGASLYVTDSYNYLIRKIQ